MNERTEVSLAESAAGAPWPAFPGATGVTMLEVYDWPTPDGLRGGSAHVHLASTEGYVVLSGSGRLQTLGEHGYAETGLSPGDCLWFPPGTIHRLVNDGGLRILVVMQNTGLPEDGDAVLTFPPAVLADGEAYARAASLSGPDLAGEALRRRDLAISGYLALREAVLERGPDALDGFFAAAMKLVSGRVDGWRERWQDGALAAAAVTGVHLDEIASGVTGHLAAGGVWRIPRPSGPAGYGMCGRLTTYPLSRATRAG